MLLTAIRIVLASAVAVTMGYAWTVGQGGFKTTNQNLCELWANLPLPAYSACEFQYVLVILWLLVALVTGVWLLFEVRRLIGRITFRRTKLLVLWILVVFFVAGSGLSLVLLVSEYRKDTSKTKISSNLESPSTLSGNTARGGDATYTDPAPQHAQHVRQKPSAIQNLSSLSKDELVEYTLRFTKQLREFEANSQIARQAFDMHFPINAPEEDKGRMWHQSVKRDMELSIKIQTEFKNTYFHPMIVLRDELQSRLRRSGIFIEEKQNYGATSIQLPAFSGNLVGASPITGAADFLETLARKMP